MVAVDKLITENLDVWTGAVKPKSSAGRGRSKNGKLELYGVKKLRELILDLAVRGLLVPQDRNDERASALLERIAKSAAELIKNGKLTKKKTLPLITEEDHQFNLPGGWEVARLGDLLIKLGSGSTPRGGKNAYVNDGVPFLRSQNIWNNGLAMDDVVYITSQTHEKMGNTKVFPNDVLLNITGASLGRSTIFPQELNEANVSQHVTIIRPIVPEMANFLHMGILSPMVQKLVWGRQVGMAIEGLSKKVLEVFEFPIPPLAEQHRIVTKVDELMALCDQLEQQTEASLTAHQTLVETLLSALTNAADSNAFNDAWQRIAQHFDILFTTEHSIDQLKQTILQLAVMGKLVAQDPKDKPASELLKRIKEEKQHLVNEKKIKVQKQPIEISDKEIPFEIPEGWTWCYLSDINALVTDGDHQSPPKADAGIPFLVIGNLNSGVTIFTNCKYVPPNYYDALDWGRKPNQRDLLYTVTGSYGIPVTINSDDSFCVQRHVAILKATDSTPREYLFYALKSKMAYEYATLIATGIAQKTVPLTGLRRMLIALPPNSEQQRIVAKVDELFKICEVLNNRIQESLATKILLANSILEKMGN